VMKMRLVPSLGASKPTGEVSPVTKPESANCGDEPGGGGGAGPPLITPSPQLLNNSSAPSGKDKAGNVRMANRTNLLLISAWVFTVMPGDASTVALTAHAGKAPSLPSAQRGVDALESRHGIRCFRHRFEA
jgi:hypothetical protein